MRFHTLSGEEFLKALSASRAPIVIDVRRAQAFEDGHVAGSRHIPVHDLPQRRAELPSSLVERVLIVGDTPKRVMAAANFIVLVGYGDVGILGGGIEAFPGELETGPPPPPKAPGPELRVID
jgi:hydroxyacylglutathione hydrolase